MEIKISILSKKATIPKYESEYASGFDISACIDAPFDLKPGDWAKIPTGLKFQIPEGYELQIRSRSGLSYKNGIVVKNSPGTIDADYRGQVFVLIHNEGSDSFTIQPGMRIAQGVICPVVRAEFVECEDLEETKRGERGFGSTGI